MPAQLWKVIQISLLLAFTLTLSSAIQPLAAQSLIAPAAPTWQFQAPLPTGNELEGVDMISATEGWAVGQVGTILHTTNGGITWASQNSGVTDPLYAVRFLDALHGWATGNIMLYTTDGGQTWLRGNSLTASNYGLDFADLNNGWAVGIGGVVFRSTDGGRNWSWLLTSTTANLKDVDFVDGQNGWAVGADGAIIHTTDGGSTWSLQTSNTTAYLDGVSFINAKEGWAAGGNVILHTTNGGTTWQPETVPANTWVYSLVFVDGLNGWGAGENQQVVHTSDGGNTWVMQTGGPGNPYNKYRLFGVDFGDTLHGVALGEGGNLFSTSDGGVTWIQRQSGSGTFTNGLAAIDRDHAWAAQTFGEILYTTNGGQFWNRTNPGYQYSHFYDIDFVDLSTGWAVGDGDQSNNYGVVFRSTDGGATWQQQWAGSSLTILYGVDAIDAQTIVAVGNLGIILRSTNGGASWAQVPHPSISNVLQGIYFLDAQRGWVVGNEGAVLSTTDGGATWTGRNILPDNNGLTNISFADANNGWTVGYNGNVWHTTDGGTTWQQQNAHPPFNWTNFAAVNAISPTEAWLSGTDAFVAHTTDGGNTWGQVTLAADSRNSFPAMVFLAADYGWLGGSTISPQGGIWRYSDNGQTNVMHVANIIPGYVPSGNQYRIRTSVTIQDANGAGVPSATVSLQVILPNGRQRTLTATTNSAGTASVSFRTSQRGTYTFCVTNVSKTDWTYDPTQNAETCDSLTIP